MDFADSVQEQLSRWDAGGIVWSVELGGLGPAYEQAIQVAAIEFSREAKDLKLNLKDKNDSTKKFTAACEAVLAKHNEALGGLSGAQFGAARWLAYQWCFNGGPRAVAERAEKRGEGDRLIQITKFFPRAATP